MKGWDVVALGDIFEIGRGGSPRPISDFLTDDPDGINWVSISDATDSSKFITKTERRIKPSGVSRSRMVKEGDFLLTNSMSFGRPYIMKTRGCIHDGWLVLSDKTGRADPDFFYHLLGSNLIYRQFERLAAGVTVKNLNIELVSGVKVPLPPLEEQKRIAAILDAADALKEKRRAAFRIVNQLEQSIFVAMFGDPLRGSVRKGVTVADVTTRITYGFTSPMSHLDNGIPIITAKNVRDGFIDLENVHFADELEFSELTDKCKPRPGDILVTKDGTIGRCAIVPDGQRLCINQSVALVQPDGSLVRPTYLMAYLMTPQVQHVLKGMSKGNALVHLQITELAKLPIPLPEAAQQEQFEHKIAAVAATRQRLEASGRQIELLSESLQDRAFRGDM